MTSFKFDVLISPCQLLAIPHMQIGMVRPCRHALVDTGHLVIGDFSRRNIYLNPPLITSNSTHSFSTPGQCKQIIKFIAAITH